MAFKLQGKRQKQARKSRVLFHALPPPPVRPSTWSIEILRAIISISFPFCLVKAPYCEPYSVRLAVLPQSAAQKCRLKVLPQCIALKYHAINRVMWKFRRKSTLLRTDEFASNMVQCRLFDDAFAILSHVDQSLSKKSCLTGRLFNLRSY